jgi:hypothetical protein
MAQPYNITLIAGWDRYQSKKTPIDKFKELPSWSKNGNWFRREAHVNSLEESGQFNYSDKIGWFIVVDYKVYKVAEMTKDEYFDPYGLLGDKIIDNEPWVDSNVEKFNRGTGLTEPKPDPEKDPEKTNPPGGSGNENSDAAQGSFIQGVSNNTLYAVAGFLVLIIVLISSKKWRR